MDPLTHALGGALLARASAPAPAPGALSLRTRMAAGGAAALFPDVDVALRLIDTLDYLNWHQGLTHAPLLLPAWAWGLARLFARLDPQHHHWRAFYGPACLGITIHVAGDFVTAYGLMPLAPLSTQRLALPLAFVVDPWLSALHIAGLLGAAGLRHGRWVARLALLASLAYLGFLGVQQQRALEFGAAHATGSGRNAAAVHALPQPLSPFHWLIVVSAGDYHDVARISLAAKRQPSPAREPISPRPEPISPLRALYAAYRPPAQAQWQRLGRFGDTPETTAFAQAAWQQPAFAGFRRFALLPVLDRSTDGSAPCAWFSDLRFSLPTLPPSFRYGLCRDGNAWQLRRARGAFWID